MSTSEIPAAVNGNDRALHFIDMIGSSSTGSLLPSCQRTIFVREENKKSSFVLSNTVALEARHLAKKIESKGGCSNPGDETTCAASETSVATASISYSSSEKYAPEEMFLFGGFELIASVKSMQVFVTRRSETGEEYLTSCKGIPAHDLPLQESAQYIDWFKFVLASPGGAKPVYRVRLEFGLPSESNQSSVTVRLLKVKCRLSHTEPVSSATTLQSGSTPTEGIENNLASVMAMMGNIGANTRMMPPQNIERTQNAGDMNNLASMLTPMGSTRISPQNINPGVKQQPQEDVRSLSDVALMIAMMGDTRSSAALSSPHSTQQSIQQHNQQEQEKYQAQIMSSIAGLGMFLKSSEEKTIDSFETILAQMESRIMNKLDGLSSRMDAIEQNMSLMNNTKSVCGGVRDTYNSYEEGDTDGHMIVGHSLKGSTTELVKSDT